MPLDLKIFKPAVKDAIVFLAPYFHIFPEILSKFSFPNLKETSGKTPSFLFSRNEIKLNKKDYKNKENIGHEVGHYLHYQINPIIWTDKSHHRCDKMVKEGVADYAELIYVNQRDILQNPKLGLPWLSRATYVDYRNWRFERALEEFLKNLEEIKINNQS